MVGTAPADPFLGTDSLINCVQGHPLGLGDQGNPVVHADTVFGMTLAWGAITRGMIVNDFLLTHDNIGEMLTPGYLSCVVPQGARPINGSDGQRLIADNEGDLAPASLFNSETLIYPAYQVG